MKSYLSLDSTRSQALSKRHRTGVQIKTRASRLVQVEMRTIEFTLKSSASRIRACLGRARTIKSPSRSQRTRICPSLCSHAFLKRQQFWRRSRTRAQAPTESRICSPLAGDTFFLRPKTLVCHSSRDRPQNWEVKGSSGRHSHEMCQVLVLTLLRTLESQTDLR